MAYLVLYLPLAVIITLLTAAAMVSNMLSHIIIRACRLSDVSGADRFIDKGAAS